VWLCHIECPRTPPGADLQPSAHNGFAGWATSMATRVMSSTTPQPQRSTPRSYLRAADRRRHLLAAAARLVAREGLGGLSMVGVAAEAGVSRQLVYEHFPDLPTLVVALLEDRFGELEATIGAALARRSAGGGRPTRLAARELLALPAVDRHMLRVLVAHAGTSDHELAAIAVRLRTRMIDRWMTALPAGDGPPSRALVWALVNALLGLGDVVDAGVLSLDDALGQFDALLAGAGGRLHA